MKPTTMNSQEKLGKGLLTDLRKTSCPGNVEVIRYTPRKMSRTERRKLEIEALRSPVAKAKLDEYWAGVRRWTRKRIDAYDPDFSVDLHSDEVTFYWPQEFLSVSVWYFVLNRKLKSVLEGYERLFKQRFGCPEGITTWRDVRTGRVVFGHKIGIHPWNTRPTYFHEVVVELINDFNYARVEDGYRIVKDICDYLVNNYSKGRSLP